MRFNFGKHDGRKVKDVPTGYLLWCLREVKDLGFLLHEAIREELAARGHGQTQQDPPRQQQQSTGHGVAVMPVESLRLHIKRWHSEMCRRFHPDSGGFNERMLALNLAVEHLKSILGLGV